MVGGDGINDVAFLRLKCVCSCLRGCFVTDYRRHACEFPQTLPSYVQPLELRRLDGVAGFEQGCLVAWSDLEVL
jgi:hypothetical protein